MSDDRGRGRRPDERTDRETVGDLVEAVTRKLTTAIVIAGALIALGIYSQDVEAPDYQIAASADGRVYRVNTESGSIVGCENNVCALLQRSSDDLADKLPERPAVTAPPQQAQPALPAPARTGDNAAAPVPERR
ncbi:MAG TPA: hypothetical protein VLK25_03865 [Allosphingosinicella sp.]|nr:hypothetical protein [Allosphingosinicella sp.]